jgi:hypothetical protein
MKYTQLRLGVIAIFALLMTTPYYAGYAATRNVQEVLVPSGTVIPVQMIDSISSDRNYAGQTFRGSLGAPIRVHNRTVLPQGSTAYIQLVEARSAGNIKGRSELVLQLYRVVTPNRTYAVHSDAVSFRGSSQSKKTAKSAGIGAAVGGGLGALFGGGKGAAIGAGVGAGAGVASRAYKGGRQISIPSESLVNFRLAAPIRVR